MPIEKSLLSVRDLWRSTFDSKFEKSTFGTGEVKSTTSIIGIYWLKKSHSILGDLWLTVKVESFGPFDLLPLVLRECWEAADLLDNAEEPSLRSRREDLNWTMLVSSHWENPTIGGKLINWTMLMSSHWEDPTIFRVEVYSSCWRARKLVMCYCGAMLMSGRIS